MFKNLNTPGVLQITALIITLLVDLQVYTVLAYWLKIKILLGIVILHKRTLTYYQAINEAQDQSLARDSSVYLIGLGVPDKIGVFGTTKGLQEKYGKDRVYDAPISENALTGIAIGSSLNGMRPVMCHNRFEFALLAMEQIVNQAAKWYYMFDGQASVPLTIRLIVGRGWGQGPQHSQSLHAWFAHIPGLKIVLPVTPYDAKGLLATAIADNNPVICVEHRWLHNLADHVPEEYYTIPIGLPRIVLPGKHITVVAISYMVIEAIKAARQLHTEGIEVEVIDVRSIAPLQYDMIYQSVAKTNCLMVCDHASYTGSFAGEIIAKVTENCFSDLHKPPVRIALPDCPLPTTRALANHYYPTAKNIIYQIKKILGEKIPIKQGYNIQATDLYDVPDKTFSGPF